MSELPPHGRLRRDLLKGLFLGIVTLATNSIDLSEVNAGDFYEEFVPPEQLPLDREGVIRYMKNILEESIGPSVNDVRCESPMQAWERYVMNAEGENTNFSYEIYITTPEQRDPNGFIPPKAKIYFTPAGSLIVSTESDLGVPQQVLWGKDVDQWLENELPEVFSLDIFSWKPGARTVGEADNANALADTDESIFEWLQMNVGHSDLRFYAYTAWLHPSGRGDLLVPSHRNLTSRATFYTDNGPYDIISLPYIDESLGGLGDTVRRGKGVPETQRSRKVHVRELQVMYKVLSGRSINIPFLEIFRKPFSGLEKLA